MTRRSFRAFATKNDLLSIFIQFESVMDVYYVPPYSDTGMVEIDHIAKIELLGINKSSSHLGEQFLAFERDTKCIWREYQWKSTTGLKTRYSTLCDENEGRVDISLGGIDDSDNLFPTTISTMHYDNESSKKMYGEIKKIIRKCSAITVNGYFVCLNAYEKRKDFRFCTIDVKSPKEYDLVVQQIDR